MSLRTAESGEAIQKPQERFWIASSLALLAMTVFHAWGGVVHLHGVQAVNNS